MEGNDELRPPACCEVGEKKKGQRQQENQGRDFDLEMLLINNIRIFRFYKHCIYEDAYTHLLLLIFKRSQGI